MPGAQRREDIMRKQIELLKAAVENKRSELASRSLRDGFKSSLGAHTEYGASGPTTTANSLRVAAMGRSEAA